jgi:membrane protease YdiL (CAAX protease family)
MGDVNNELTRDLKDMSWKLTVIIVTSVLAAWGWIMINVPPLKDIATVYLFMAIGALVLGMGAFISDNKFPFSVLGCPKIRDLVLPLLVGATYGVIYIFVGNFVGIAITSMSKMFTLTITSPFLTLAPLALLIIYGLFAPLAEDILFQATWLPLIGRLFGNKWVGLVLTGLAFGGAHYFFLGGEIGPIAQATVFYFGAGILTVKFKTAATAIAAHITFNSIIVYLYVTSMGLTFI